MTLIFGYNSHGKSTLTELFRSLESGDVTDVQSRLSIPGGKLQTASFHFSESGKPEVPFVYDGAAWGGKITGNYQIKVFDSGFVNRNVLSGDAMVRENKESFSRFVLGEDGVTQVEAIATKKQNARSIKAQAKAVGERIKVIAGQGDVDKFVAMKVLETPQELKSAYDASAVALVKIRENKINVETIKKRPQILGYGKQSPLAEILTRLEPLLALNLDDLHSSARTRLDEHVTEHMKTEQEARDWIQKGFGFIKDKACPFCEQILSAPALSLIDCYQDAFNDEFKKKSKELVAGLIDLDTHVIEHNYPDAGVRIIDDVKTIALYPELATQLEFITLTANLTALGARLTEQWPALLALLIAHKLHARKAIEQKKKSLFEPIQLSDFQLLKTLEDHYASIIFDYGQLVDKINETLLTFKNGASIEAFTEQENVALAAQGKIEAKIKRLDNEPTCREYLEKLAEGKRIDEEIARSQKALDLEQSDYLDNFFEKINAIFTKLGSKDFSIVRVKEGRGDLPVYSLSVKFKGQDVDSKKLGMVFSESDRRALALSVFWARIATMDAATLATTIVVLDDPATSFDDDRMAAAFRYMSIEAANLRQVIMLTHYREFVRRVLVNKAIGNDFCLLSVEKDGQTSNLDIADSRTFAESEHHQKFRVILDFVEQRKTDVPIDNDLRIFLEEELKARFRLAVAQHKLEKAMLSDLISGLHAANAITDNMRDKLETFRKDLNPVHHAWNTRTPGDWAALAQEILDFVYCDL